MSAIFLPDSAKQELTEEGDSNNTLHGFISFPEYWTAFARDRNSESLMIMFMVTEQSSMKGFCSGKWKIMFTMESFMVWFIRDW